LKKYRYKTELNTMQWSQDISVLTMWHSWREMLKT